MAYSKGAPISRNLCQGPTLLTSGVSFYQEFLNGTKTCRIKQCNQDEQNRRVERRQWHRLEGRLGLPEHALNK
jgi:hypothetical protein